ncbi:MAG: T9SS type A sorting domain-containing protein, partial [Chitinophagales bacterium]
TNTTIILDGIDGYDGYSLSEFTEYNGRLYFVIGHSMLATLNDAETKTESVYEMAGEISNLHEVNNELYFTVMNTDNFFPVGHLWQSNGTTSGTYQLDFFPAVVSELSTEVSGQILLTDGNLMFLGLNDEATGTELWKYEAAGNTGIQNHVSNSSLLNVFPNPSSSGVFQFNVPELKNPALLELSDISGRKVYEEKIGNGSGAIDISGFSKGLYVLTISNQELRSVSKLIYE